MTAAADIGLIGGGEHASVVADAIERAGLRVAGCWAPECLPGLHRLGDDAALLDAIQRGEAGLLHLAFVGRPGSGARRGLVQRLEAAARVRWTAVCHPSAIVSRSAVLLPGSFVAAGAVLNPRTEIHAHAIVNTGAIIEHDGIVEEGAHVAPGAITGGKVRIGAWAYVGLGAVLRDHVTVGAGAVVGMGAVVVGDVPEGACVIGNPARAMPRT